MHQRSRFLPDTAMSGPREEDEQQDSECTENPFANPDEDIQRLAPALTSFMTSDAFLCSLITAAVEKASSQQSQQPDRRQLAQMPGGEPPASTSTCQSDEPDGAGQAHMGSTTTTQPQPGPSGSAASQSPEATFKAGEVTVLLKALQNTTAACPPAQVDHKWKDQSRESDSDETPPPKQAATKMAKKTWAAPAYKDPSQCSWRNQDSVNRHRYRALADIASRLHAF